MLGWAGLHQPGCGGVGGQRSAHPITPCADPLPCPSPLPPRRPRLRCAPPLQVLEAQAVVLERQEAAAPGSEEVLGQAKGVLARLDALRGLLQDASSALLANISSASGRFYSK